MTTYYTTIGLEIHAELKTNTKMFCASRNNPHEQEPNIHICPICMAHPGTLPTINKKAVASVLAIGCAVKGKIAPETYFERKNYFYPDIPKGYQISQYAYPLVSEGLLAGVAITRIHLEEDTARSLHVGDGSSLVDFNRAGVPLMELVTEPVITSSQQAVYFAKELQLLLRYLGISDANMEKGEMRIEANISLSSQKNVLGTKVEVKNLNSFRAVERAIAFEQKRQESLLEGGELVVQETRGWDEAKQKTIAQRKKESSEDYRYFPDPDLPRIVFGDIKEFDINSIKKTIPELPEERRSRYQKLGISLEQSEILVRNKIFSDFLEKVWEGKEDQKDFVRTAVNYMVSDLFGMLRERAGEDDFDLPNTISSESFAQLIHMALHGEISSRGAKDILKIMYEQGGYPELIARESSLLQENDSDKLEELVEEILETHKEVAESYRTGKDASLQFLVGQGMKASKGSANPQKLQTLLREKLGG